MDVRSDIETATVIMVADHEAPALIDAAQQLADQTLDATREYQYRKPANDVNDAPRQM